VANQEDGAFLEDLNSIAYLNSMYSPYSSKSSTQLFAEGTFFVDNKDSLSFEGLQCLGIHFECEWTHFTNTYKTKACGYTIIDLWTWRRKWLPRWSKHNLGHSLDIIHLIVTSHNTIIRHKGSRFKVQGSPKYVALCNGK